MIKTHYSKLELFIRSLIFSIYSLASMLIWGTVVLLLAFLPLRYRHGLIRLYLRAYMQVLKTVCHIHYDISGLENIPKGRTGIVMSKHQSAWETFYLPIMFHDPAIILKKELLWLPFFGWGLWLADPIAIDRNNRASAMQQIITKGKKRLDDGRWVLVFPEGTRVPPGAIGQYKLGGARLAAATGYPIIPVAHNAGYCWPKRHFIKRPGTIKMVIGPLIESTGRTPDALLKLTKDWIETTMISLTLRP